MAQHVQKVDRHGRPLPDDDDIIPDGGHVRVPASFMDHLPEGVRRALGITDGGAVDVQGFPIGHRPGFAVASVKNEAARDKYIRNVGDAWKNPPPEQPTQRFAFSSPTPNTQDAKQSYRAYVDRISNAWRSR